MKQLLFVVLALAAAMVNGNSVVAQSNPSTFEREDQCNDALASGNFSYYVPVNLSRHEVNQINKLNGIFAVVVKADQCRNQHTEYGWKWVPVKKGSKLRAKYIHGRLFVFASDNCGNGDLTWMYRDDQVEPENEEPKVPDPPVTTKERQQSVVAPADDQTTKKPADNHLRAQTELVILQQPIQNDDLATKVATLIQKVGGCKDLTPKSMTTPAQGILRDLTTVTEQDCGTSTTKYVDHQETILDAKRDIELARIQAQVDRAKAKAEAKAEAAKAKAEHSGDCNWFCRVLNTPVCAPGYVCAGSGYWSNGVWVSLGGPVGFDHDFRSGNRGGEQHSSPPTAPTTPINTGIAYAHTSRITSSKNK